MATRRQLLNRLVAVGGLSLAPGRRRGGELQAAADDDDLMGRAFAFRDAAIASGDQPYGAVVVKDGQVVGEGPSRVIVDGDTGFGGPLNVLHMVESLVQMGAAGVILEDQTWPKRCGHMRGKSVVPMEEHVAKIRAAVDVRDRLKESFIITARTDARGPLGIDEAIRRGIAYREAGASIIFVEAPESEEELRRIASEIPGLKTVNNIEGGKTPILPLERAHELGFVSVGFVLTGLYAAARAIQQAYQHLLEHGTSQGLEERMMSFEEFGEVVGLEEKYALDEKFAAEEAG